MIEVILREDVRTLGRAGEMVRVKPGYARNYLLPKGLAYEATEGNKKRIAAETRARTSRNEAERTEAQRVAATLAGVTLKLSGKAGEEEQDIDQGPDYRLGGGASPWERGLQPA